MTVDVQYATALLFFLFLIVYLEAAFSTTAMVFETLRPLKMNFKSHLFPKHLGKRES